MSYRTKSFWFTNKNACKVNIISFKSKLLFLYLERINFYQDFKNFHYYGIINYRSMVMNYAKRCHYKKYIFPINWNTIYYYIIDSSCCKIIPIVYTMFSAVTFLNIFYECKINIFLQFIRYVYTGRFVTYITIFYL